MPSFFTQMTMRARRLFALGLLGILALVGIGAWWALTPDYAALAGDLRPADATEIGTALSEWGIPYRFEDGNKTVLVPRESVYTTRMKLASEGIPRGGSVGFEAFKDSDYGVSEFAQRINYQRALQGELERTIESMREVRSARVHLTIHRAGLFERDQEGSKASVSITLRDGHKLGVRQVAGIQRLVASAVEGLVPVNVTLLDEQGAAWSGGSDALSSAGSLEDRTDQAARLESALQAQASALLAGALHRKDFTVSVAVRLNYDRVKRVGNRVLAGGKNEQGVLIREKTDSNRGAAQAESGGNTASSREVEYAHGTEQEEVVLTPGRIERIGVGIVLPANVPQARFKDLADVVSAGIGLDAARGDRVELTTATAAPSAVAPPEAERGVVAVPDIASGAASKRHSATVPAFNALIYVFGGGLLVIACLAMLMVRRRPQPPRLTAAERQETLDRIRQWIETPERTP